MSEIAANPDSYREKKMVKIDANNYTSEDFGPCRFVPLLKEKGKD